MKINKAEAGFPRRRRQERARWCGIALVLLVIFGALVAWHYYRRDEPRRSAWRVLSEVERALSRAELAETLPLLELSPVVAARSPAEQTQWVSDVLRDEISVAGLNELRRHGRFGSLIGLFPEEATSWAEAARLPVEDCVAFRMERNGTRAEVVLHEAPLGFRVLRCNNVKQMAPATHTDS